MTGPFAGKLSPGNKLCSDHGHLARSIDPKPDLAPLKADDSHTDVVADIELLH